MRILTLLAVLAAYQPLFSQKIDLDAEPIPVSYVRLPLKPMPADHQLYSVTVSANPKDLASLGLSESALSNPFNKLSGFELVPEGGDFNIEVHLGDFRWGKNEPVTKSNTFKDKNGKETTEVKYYANQGYTHTLRTEVQNKAGKVVHKYEWLDGERSFKTPEFKTQAELGKYQNDRMGKDVANQDQKEILVALQQAYGTYDSYYGYSPVTEETKLWILDSDKHPEYAEYQANYKSLKTAFEKMNPGEPLDAVKAAAQPSLDFFEKKKDTYDVSEKSGKKMRYSCLYNLALVNFWLENFEASERYANEVVANDYDKKDGERILESIVKLREQFTQTGKTTRHFVVKTTANTAAAASDSTQTVVFDSDREERIEKYKNEKLKAKPGHAKFDGTVTYMDGSEQKGKFLINPLPFNPLIFGAGGNIKFYIDKGDDVSIVDLNFNKMTNFTFDNRKFSMMLFSSGNVNIGKGENTILEVLYETDNIAGLLAYNSENLGVNNPPEYVIYDVPNRHLQSLGAAKFLLNFNKGIKKEYGEKCPAVLEAIEKEEFGRNNKDIIRLAKLLDGCLPGN